MQFKTYTADKVDMAKEIASYDKNAKMLISDPPILAYILSRTVPELRGMPTDEIIRRMGERHISAAPLEPGMTKMKLDELNTEQSEANEGTTFFDVLFTVVHMDDRDIDTYLYIDVEIQRDEYVGYDILPRAVFYCGRLLSMQYGMDVTYKDYGGLKKVYSIWLCLNCPKRDANTITRYRLCREDVYGVCGDHPYDYIEIVMVRLPKRDEDISDDNELLGMVGRLLSPSVGVDEKKRMLESECGIPMTEEVEGRSMDMCNLGEGIYFDGMEQGMKQGVKQGMKQGMKQGGNIGSLKKGLQVYNNCIDRNMSHEDALAIAEMSEKDLEDARKL